MSHQPTIVIAASEPEWAFALQGSLRASLGWDYDILITFTAPQALDYVLRRAAALLITGPRMARRADVMDVPELLAAVRERAPGTAVLAVPREGGEQGADDEKLLAAIRAALGAAGASPPAEGAHPSFTSPSSGL